MENITLEPTRSRSYSMYFCEECKGSRPCYCLMETVFTPHLCIDESGPEGAKWRPISGKIARIVFEELNVSDAKWYEPPEEE